MKKEIGSVIYVKEGIAVYLKDNFYLLLEAPVISKANLADAKKWCEKKGGDLGSAYIWRFIGKNMEAIRKHLKSCPELPCGPYWSSDPACHGDDGVVVGINGHSYLSNQEKKCYYKCILTISD